jgi:hypothetical protein
MNNTGLLKILAKLRTVQIGKTANYRIKPTSGSNLLAGLINHPIAQKWAQIDKRRAKYTVAHAPNYPNPYAQSIQPIGNFRDNQLIGKPGLTDVDESLMQKLRPFLDYVKKRTRQRNLPRFYMQAEIGEPNSLYIPTVEGPSVMLAQNTEPEEMYPKALHEIIHGLNAKRRLYGAYTGEPNTLPQGKIKYNMFDKLENELSTNDQSAKLLRQAAKDSIVPENYLKEIAYPQLNRSNWHYIGEAQKQYEKPGITEEERERFQYLQEKWKIDQRLKKDWYGKNT